MKPIRLVELFPGSSQVAVYRPRNKEPHFIVVGACMADLDEELVAKYMYGCDWTDRGAKGWITPSLRCDEFLKKKGPHESD